jgi:type I restriction enzyme, S subunit
MTDEEWPQVPLGTVVQNFDAKRVPLSSRERDKRRGRFPYYGATGVMDHVDDYLFEGLHLLVAEDGSVETPAGKPFLKLVQGRFWVNNHAHVLKAARDEDTKYLFYALGTVAIRPFMSGSVQAKLSQGNMNKIPVPYPNSEARRAIAHVLGTLDDKIDLNRRMNETLEAIARALFKSWFVDFDPVRAKAEGRKTGLPPEIDALFPDGFDETEIGEVPKGWEVGTLAALAVLNPEAWSKQSYPETIRYVDLANTKWGRIEDTTTYEVHHAPSRAQRVLRPGDTIVGTVRPGNGSFALVHDEGLTGSTGFAVLRPMKSFDTGLIYLSATSPDNIDALAHLADGAAYPAVRPDVVAQTPVVVAPRKVRGAFGKIVSPLLARFKVNETASTALAAVRDTLLPRLVSGEVRLPPPGIEVAT